MFRKTRRIHMVGIGGSGMSGIAEVLADLGFSVSGSDMAEGANVRRLRERGCTVHIGHDAAHIHGVDVVVRSSAIGLDNPEIEAARDACVPVIPRAEMLGELMRMKYGLAVAGSHGKTTTTSMLSAVLGAAGLDPTVVVGGKVHALGSNARLGQGEFMVAEADESDGSFLHLDPTIAVVTNIDLEHLDHYGSVEGLSDCFATFINRVPFFGLAVLCLDDPNIQRIIPRVQKRYLTYGLSAQADLRAVDLHLDGNVTHFTAVRSGKWLGKITLPLPGRHMALNALAVIAVALELDVPFQHIRRALSEFSGVGRRFEVRGNLGGIMVIDDYAHHPTEIRATLAAAREGFGRRLVTVFQPHRYSRTRDCLDAFVSAFNDSDQIGILPIYAAGEAPIEGISGEALQRAVKQHGHKHAVYLSDMDQAMAWVDRVAKSGDLVLTLGAGSITQLGPRLVEHFRGRQG